MTKSGKSLFYFGIYDVFAGLLFIFIPEFLISLLNLPELHPGWSRVIGLLILVVGTNNIISGKENITSLIKASVYIRFCFASIIVLIVVSGLMPVTLIILGSVDAIGALWTSKELKSEKINL